MSGIQIIGATIAAFFYILVSTMAGGLVASAMLTFGANSATAAMFFLLTSLVTGAGLFILERSVRHG